MGCSLELWTQGTQRRLAGMQQDGSHMTTFSTEGFQVGKGGRRMRAAVELLSSMRFAIALLTVICIASVIGTVVKQHEPYNNYINQFGLFWAQVFDVLGLYSVYSAWWFLLILAFLVTSTSLCIARNTPKILQDLRSFKENIHEQALRAFGQKATAEVAGTPEEAARRLGQSLVRSGWKVRLQERRTAQGMGWMVAAKAGSWNKIGYLAAHCAIVLICLGGLFDGDLMVRAQTWFNGKQVYRGAGMIAEVPAASRLGPNNPSFRGNLFVPEGASASSAILSQKDGVLVQDLPFSIELKKFIVEYYPTGMPRLFASDVILRDRTTGEQHPARIEVNHPASFKGIEIYQSSFEDGGSSVTLKAVPMGGAAVAPFEVHSKVGESTTISNGKDQRTLEITNLRVINVENFGKEGEGNGVDVRKVDLQHTLNANLGSAQSRSDKQLRNVGPSIAYKLRDASGQAREFNNYMQPVASSQGGVPEFLFGVRTDPNQPFRYLRIPADDKGGLGEFQRLRTALMTPAMRAEAVRRYAAEATTGQPPEVVKQLTASAERVMDLFAGDPAKMAQAGLDPNGAAARGFGLQAVASFIEKTVPADQQARVGDVLLKILNGSLLELAQLERAQAHLPALDMGQERNRAFMVQAVVALSDAPLYPEPLLFQLQDFKQVQASVFQVTRSPGKWVVYTGCFFLILGVFAMLYIRERRVWVWLTPVDGQEGVSAATMALSSNRRNLESDREFEVLKDKLLGIHA